MEAIFIARCDLLLDAIDKSAYNRGQKVHNNL